MRTLFRDGSADRVRDRNGSAWLLPAGQGRVNEDLRARMRTFADDDEVDAVIVGCGAGGSTMAQRLARALAQEHGLQVSGHCAPNLHAPVAAATENLRHLEWFHDHVRIESMLFHGALDPTGGTVRPDSSHPGHGLSFNADTAQTYLRRDGYTIHAP